MPLAADSRLTCYSLSCLREVERVPGTAFGMTLYSAGGEAYSDFEVVVLEAY